MFELVFFISVELFHRHALSERTRVSDGIENRGSSGEYKQTVVEMPVMVVTVAVDVGAVQDAGNSGRNAAEATTVLTLVAARRQ